MCFMSWCGVPPLAQASLPVQQYLAMPFEQIQKQTEVARHLPPPLYVLFVQANAYGQACGEQSRQRIAVLEYCRCVWSNSLFIFCFRQESECVHQRWCGWSQGSVQASGWFPGYEHYNMSSLSCAHNKHHHCPLCRDLSLQGSNGMCCVLLQMTRVIRMPRRSKRKRWVSKLIFLIVHNILFSLHSFHLFRFSFNLVFTFCATEEEEAHDRRPARWQKTRDAEKAPSITRHRPQV